MAIRYGARKQAETRVGIATALACALAGAACSQPVDGYGTSPNPATGGTIPFPTGSSGVAGVAPANTAGTAATAGAGGVGTVARASGAAAAGSAGTSSQPTLPMAGSDAPGAPDSGTPAADAGSMEPPRMDLGMGDGHDVITIGDSWMSLGFNGIQNSLVEASGQPYRTYGAAATRLLNGQIPGQYDRAKSVDPDIKTVVMTGGGNDILLTGLQADCAAGGMRCQEQLMMIGIALRDLWQRMADDGVQDVIHVLYSSDAGSGVDESISGREGLITLCENAALHCHLLPTDDLVNGDLALDGVHPSAAAYDRIGKAVFDLMVAEGMRR